MNVEGKKNKNVASKNLVIYKNLPIFRTDKPPLHRGMGEVLRYGNIYKEDNVHRKMSLN